MSEQMPNKIDSFCIELNSNIYTSLLGLYINIITSTRFPNESFTYELDLKLYSLTENIRKVGMARFL